MTETTIELRLHESWIAPPVVAGATPTPYPAHVAAPGHWIDAEHALRDTEATRRRTLAAPLPPGTRSEVALRGLPTPIFRRVEDGPWVLDDEGMAVLLAHIERTHVAPPYLSQRHTLEYDLPAFLQQVLRDQNWFAPAEPPSISAALTTFFTQAYTGRKPGLDPIFPGERAHAAAMEHHYYNDDPYEPWQSRDSRQYVERMIAASGRITPYRLRPLVLTKSNAAKREWHYGAWGVYDVLPSGQIGAFLALYGRSAVGQGHTWHEVLWDEERYPRPEPEVSGVEITWYGLYLEREYPRYSFPEIRCAMTGALLAEWSPTPAADERPPEAFVPVEVTLPPMGEDDVYRPAQADLGRDTEA